MPYIKQDDRIRAAKLPETSGELNYAITTLILDYLGIEEADHSLRYSDYNTVIGVLECCKLEVVRRLLVPYEEMKCKLNGDVY